MAAGPNRYEPLREATREAETRKSDAAPSQENPRADAKGQDAALDHATQQVQPAPVLDGPTRPTSVPRQSPGWTDSASLEDQTRSADAYNDWLQAVYKERFETTRQGEHGQAAPQQTEASKAPPATRNQVRTFEDLKNEHTKSLQSAKPAVEQTKATEKPADEKKPSLTFNWDQDRSLERER